MTEKQREVKLRKRNEAVKKIAKRVKDRIMEIGFKTGCGHIASALSVAEVLVATYYDAPDAIVILSKGHGALAQYIALDEMGISRKNAFVSFRSDGGVSEHTTLDPENHIFASTGSLGHGLAIGIGYAIANPDKKVVVILGDGECDEGSTLESLQIISKLRIRNILPVVDVNGWAGIQSVNEDLLPKNVIKYYSIKGEGWGELENTLDSHYKKVDESLYNLYQKKT